MPITINDQFAVQAGRSVDNRLGKLVAGQTVPFASVAEANTAIPAAYRHLGLVVMVSLSGLPVDHYYRDGIADANLVEKLPAASASTSGYLSQADWLTFSEQSTFRNTDFSGAGTDADPYTLIKDTTPTSGSLNPITSNAVYVAIQNLQSQINAMSSTTTTTTLP